jgi:hypothetical protein
MKNATPIFVTLITIVSIILGCSPNNSPSPAAPKSNSLFDGTEWVGTYHPGNTQFPFPTCLKFKGDTVVTAYALFLFITETSEIELDSLRGKITKIDSVTTAGLTTVDIYFPVTSQQITFYLQDKTTMRGITDRELYHLSLVEGEAPSLAGTSWHGPKDSRPGGSFYYPDLTGIHFDAPLGPEKNVFNQSFTRGGSPVSLDGVVGGSSEPETPLTSVCNQKGSILYFSGYNEDERQKGFVGTVPYFGVLLADGNTMLVNSRSHTARLPNYINTNEPYGPNGVTPSMVRD